MAQCRLYTKWFGLLGTVLFLLILVKGNLDAVLAGMVGMMFALQNGFAVRYETYRLTNELDEKLRALSDRALVNPEK